MKLTPFNHKLIRWVTFNEFLLALGIFMIGIFFTWRNVEWINRSARLEFDDQCRDLRSRIKNRLDQHEQLLRDGKALFEVSDTITMQEWKDYFNKTEMHTYLPGIQGFGYTKVIYPDELAHHENLFSQLPGMKDYHVWYREEDGTRKAYSFSGKMADFYTSIIYLEPLDTIEDSQGWRNMRAIGYDMYSDSVRRVTMEAARLSGQAILSGKVKLVQETDKKVQNGVLMYIPVYRKDASTGTIGERKEALDGWVYSPYRMDNLIYGIMTATSDTTTGSEVREKIQHWLRIYDDTTLLFDNSDSLENYNEDISMEEVRKTIVFGEKRWDLIFRANRNVSPLRGTKMIVLAGGSIISVLLFLLIMMLFNANTRRREIEQLNIQLEKSDQDKNRFIAILSHDLKSPFTAILGFLELLKENLRRLTIDEIENHVKIIDESSQHTFNLLEDLLAWTRAHSGKIPFKPEMVHLDEIFRTVVTGLTPIADLKKISISFSSGEDIKAFADAEMLKTILRNLLSNAIKFTQSGGRIEVSAERRISEVEVSIKDNGIGIMPEHMNKLFDISNLVSTTGTANEKGSGIGLAICKEFVEKHMGKIVASSEPGKGSDFRFTLPDRRVKKKAAKRVG